MITKVLFLTLSLTIFISCNNDKVANETNESQPVRTAPKVTIFEIKKPGEWLNEHQPDSAQLQIVLAVNRTDDSNFVYLDSIVVPVDLSGDLEFYLPFPMNVPYLKLVNKIIFFSYASQTFATYEKGDLVHTGATNMGRANDLTPTGLFFTNWKAEETISSFNDEWNLRWNFNVHNEEGIGWHQYGLPGYPVSHACMRLTEADAKYLYTWADQWVLANKDSVLVKGTPVIIFGKYDFNAPKPWLQLVSNPHALDITVQQIQNTTQPFLGEIFAAQKSRELLQTK